MFNELGPVEIILLVLCARSEDIEEFTEEQSLMGRLVHLFKTDSADQQYQVRNQHERLR
jgi:hypothetical protein